MKRRSNDQVVADAANKNFADSEELLEITSSKNDKFIEESKAQTKSSKDKKFKQK